MAAVTPEVAAWMEENLHEHVSFIQRRTRGMRVEDTPELLVVDSGLPSDTFNKILRVRAAHEELAALLAAAARSFADRPFALWAGPSDRPEDLAVRLPASGWNLTELAMGMAMPARDLPSLPPRKDLHIRRALGMGEISDFAEVNAANWTPPDAAVMRFFQLALPLLLDEACPMQLHVAYLDGQPVAAGELFLSAGGRVAGLHMISTRAAYRRRGIGMALTWHLCGEARDAGADWLVLQASPEGEGVYRRIGFLPAGQFREYSFAG